MANELISVRIQDNCNFTGKDIEEKAAALGLNKSEFVLKAVDMLLNFDKGFYQRVEEYAEGLKVPEYIVIQNMVINQIAKKSAKAKVWGEHQEMLFEFPMISEGMKVRMITGEELFKTLEEMYIHDEKREYEKAKKSKEEKLEHLRELDPDKKEGK